MEKFVRICLEILWKHIKDFLQKVQNAGHTCLLEIQESDSFLEILKEIQRYFSEFDGNYYRISQKQERIVSLSFPVLNLDLKYVINAYIV